MAPRITVIVFALLLQCISLAQPAHSHGFMDHPNPRGGLSYSLCSKKIDPAAPADVLLGNPSGDKSRRPAAGRRSQIRTGGSYTPFTPTKKGFVWRAGVCGDARDPRQPNRGDHMKGGRFYWPPGKPRIVANYRPGGLLDVSFKTNAHHNGHIELHLCDVAKCPGGEISEECFLQGHCKQLQRAPNAACDSGTNPECGPIDRRFPGRWYLPCRKFSTSTGRFAKFGPGVMQYRLPNIRCSHCVLHFYWVGATHCNMRDWQGYFDGPDAPKWGKCIEEQAPRGWFKPQRICGGRMFPEEYYQCADISLTDGPGQREESTMTTRPPPPPMPQVSGPKRQDPENAMAKPRVPSAPRGYKGSYDRLQKIKTTGFNPFRFGAVRGLRLVADGRILGELLPGDVIDARRLRKLTFEPVVAGHVRRVEFELRDGRRTLRTVEQRRPFRMFSQRVRPYWTGVRFGREITLVVRAGGDTDVWTFTLVRK